VNVPDISVAFWVTDAVSGMEKSWFRLVTAKVPVIAPLRLMTLRVIETLSVVALVTVTGRIRSE